MDGLVRLGIGVQKDPTSYLSAKLDLHFLSVQRVPEFGAPRSGSLNFRPDAHGTSMAEQLDVDSLCRLPMRAASREHGHAMLARAHESRKRAAKRMG